MCSVAQFGCKRLSSQFNKVYNLYKPTQIRTFLSNAYYCQEVWNSRLKSPLFQKVDLDELYHELDLKYQKNQNISAVDVDIFANAVQSDEHTEELLDLVHKLRLSADTGHALESTSHSVIRNLMVNNHEKLLQILDDRLNYGIFLDYYTANILLDTFWKSKDFVSGARVACQLMLQEDFTHPLNLYLSLLHCYKYLLLKPEGWPIEEKEEEPKEEIKVRVKYIRNPFFDEHFDIKNPKHLIGKTIFMAGSANNDSLGRTFQLLGLELYEKHEEAKKLIEKFQSNKESVLKEGLGLLSDDNEIRLLAANLKLDSENIEGLLQKHVEDAEERYAEKDIAEQCKIFDTWEGKRMAALQKQQKRYEIVQKLASIEEARATLKEKELKLWFFDREEQLELDIETKKVFYPKRWFGKKKKPRKIDEGYIPPEVKSAYRKEK